MSILTSNTLSLSLILPVFAMAPLGILTAIAGAIRVGGASWLKRLVGRAFENNANVEIELMSSVSQEVCELWNGKSIVRSTGQPEVKQIIHLPVEEGDISPKSFITMDPETWSEGYKLNARNSSDNDTGSGRLSTKLPEKPSEQSMVVRVSEDEESGKTNNDRDPKSLQPKDTGRPSEYQDMPPNISLNVHGGSNPVELIMCTFIATILQVAVLAWSGFLAYSSYAQSHKLTGLKSSVGFPLQAAGTMFLTLSLVLCVGIIDNGSCERHWSKDGEPQTRTMSELLSSAKSSFSALSNKQRLAADQSSKEMPVRGRDMQLYWVQKQHTAGGNNFDPYILYAKELKDELHESHRVEEKGPSDRTNVSLKEKPIPPLLKFRRFFGRSRNQKQDPKPYHTTTFAVLFGISGFVAQFQGLRFSNWTCSIAQLIALGLATILRAWVRRNMIETPGNILVDNDYILDQLTLGIVDNRQSDAKSPNPEAFRTPRLSFAFGVTTIPKLRAVTKSESEDEVQPRSGQSNRANSERANPRLQPSIDVQHPNEPEKEPNLAQQALNLRVRLGRITKWTGPKSQEAIVLSNSIETALERLNPELPAEIGGKCAVVLRVDIHRIMPNVPATSMPGSQEEVELYIIQESKKWKVDDAQLEALLSLVSYSAWAAEQNRRNQEETDREKSAAGLESSEHSSKDQSVGSSRSIGWLRAKAPDSQIYHRVVGKSSPKLMSDLFWWTPNTQYILNKVKYVGRCKGNMVNVPIDPDSSMINPWAVIDTGEDEKAVERHALGFYANDGTSEGIGTVKIQLLVWRALTYSDAFWSLECTEQQAFVLHLFSTVMWATTDHLISASQFHPTTVKTGSKLINWEGAQFFLVYVTDSDKLPAIPKLESNKIENLVQELHSIGLGTSEEIYGVLIPPLSHFDKLPNEAVADWCNEMLIGREVSLSWLNAFHHNVGLLNAIAQRKVQDRFANRAAAIVVEFLLRVTEEPNFFTRNKELDDLQWFKGTLRELFIDDETVRKVFLSLEHILARRERIQHPFCILTKIGFKDLLARPQFRNHRRNHRLKSTPLARPENDFSFSHNTDVFGWSNNYWKAFERRLVNFDDLFPKLDLAGQPVLHHIFNYTVGLPHVVSLLPQLERTISNHFRDHGLFTARCNKQTPLHRAVRAGHHSLILKLLEKGTDPNAADHFGRNRPMLGCSSWH